MLDSATIDMVGNLLEVGRKQFEAKGSWLWQAVNVHPHMPPELRPPKFLNERIILHGEPMMLGFIVHGNAKILMAIARFEQHLQVAAVDVRSITGQTAPVEEGLWHQ
jgi:hypothetical protein